MSNRVTVTVDGRSYTLIAAEEEAYVQKVSADVNATPEQLREYFGESYMRAEFKKELATNLIVDSAVVKAAE